ncbi:MAG TPA: hypothetical protein VGI16_02535 [Candidatus Acidoferrum sp.]
MAESRKPKIRALPALDFAEHRIRERDFAVRADCNQLDKAFGLAHGKIAKQQRIDQRKDGSIRAKSQRERKYRNGRKARILA